MLEPEITYAELVVKRIKESKKKKRIDYVHPPNNIKDGFIIINYKKRYMAWEELMDGRLRMMVPKDWKLTECKNGIIYQYESSTEKERMTLIYNKEPVMENYEAQLRDYTESPKMPLKLLDIMEIPNENGNILCAFLQGENDTFFGMFFCRMGEGTLQGMFTMHRYRKKVWKYIIPQMLGTMEMPADGMERNENGQTQAVADVDEEKA